MENSHPQQAAASQTQSRTRACTRQASTTHCQNHSATVTARRTANLTKSNIRASHDIGSTVTSSQSQLGGSKPNSVKHSRHTMTSQAGSTVAGDSHS
jgi:hypothetical protein